MTQPLNKTPRNLFVGTWMTYRSGSEAYLKLISSDLYII